MMKKETLNKPVISAAIACLFLLDIFTKAVFTDKSFGVGNLVFVQYTENYGSSFGIFSGVGFYPLFILFFSLTAIVLLFAFAKRFYDDKYLTYSFIFLAGGLLGNTYDRLLFGFVKDFIGLKYLFIFNLADLYITIAFILLIVYEFKKK